MVLKLLCKVFGFLKYLRRRRAKKTTRALKKNAFDIFLTHFFVMAMRTAEQLLTRGVSFLPLRRMKCSIYASPIMEMSTDLRLYYERGTLLTKPTLYFIRAWFFSFFYLFNFFLPLRKIIYLLNFGSYLLMSTDFYGSVFFFILCMLKIPLH